MSGGAFTLGYAKSYDAYIKEYTDPADPPMKSGRHHDYAGGWIWSTPSAAGAFLASDTFAVSFPNRDPAEFAVYELELPTDWTTDVSATPSPTDGVHRLLNDARIVGRVATERVA